MDFQINNNKRIENENEYLALLLNRNNIVDFIQVEPKYLCDKNNRKLLEKLEKSQKENATAKIRNEDKIKKLYLLSFCRRIIFHQGVGKIRKSYLFIKIKLQSNDLRIYSRVVGQTDGGKPTV